MKLSNIASITRDSFLRRGIWCKLTHILGENIRRRIQFQLINGTCAKLFLIAQRRAIAPPNWIKS